MSLYQISSQLLLSLYGLEQGLKVTSSKAREVVPLDNFDEDRRAIHKVLLVTKIQYSDQRVTGWGSVPW
jgi:hypothetical protein